VLVRLVDRRLAHGLVSVAVLVVLCATASPALASFPGRNGAIAYAWTNAQKYQASRTSIRAVNPRSGRVRVLRDCPVRSHPVAGYTDCNVSVPRYSPDGLRIAFPTVQTVPDSSGQPWQYQPSLGMMASDGTGLEERATTVGYYRLAWSPAGDRFLLARQLAVPDLPKPTAIFLASLDGTELGQVTPEWTQAPDWSTTGEIAFGRYTDPACLPGCEEIWVTRVGATPRRLTYRGGFSPSWSPHGTKLAFTRSTRKSGPVDVYLIGKDGRGLRRLTYRGGDSPSWSPDGKWIAFIREGDLYVVRTDGRGLRRLVDEIGPDETYGLGRQVTSLGWQALPRR
jgi:dipeptidyl aminopeptidase/acylaminoacyl peptidase